MKLETKVKTVGFSAEKEEIFLKRLTGEIRRINLEQELKTQLAEDFGLVEFTLKYKIEKGKLVDLLSGQEVVELTSRGGSEEETISIEKIEKGLVDQPEKTWIHFSPQNEKLNYPSNCVDFWRMVDGKAVWNRIIIKNDFEEMNKTRQLLSGEGLVKDEMEIMKSPIGVEGLKLSQLFDWFRLNETKNTVNLDYIEKIVKQYLKEFENNFGEKITEDREMIFRLYSACFNGLKNKQREEIVSRRELDNYMFGVMKGVSVEKSFGCAATTEVGEFGQKIGYYISGNGEVRYGEIPDDYKECKKCGCWYKGEKCPFC